MKLPLNKFTALALVWLAVGLYALVFREADGNAPPFPHFDKLAHFSLFFAQIWLAAKAFMQENLAIPHKALLVFALLYALGSEWGQAALTATREGSFGDALADVLGACVAIWLAKRVAADKNIMPSEHKGR